jgi:hypothetical protein
MSYSRISSDGSLPQKNWSQFDLSTALTPSTAAAMLGGIRTPCERVIIRAAAANTAPVVIGPNSNASHVSLSPGDEYTIQAPPYVVFDLARWYCISTAASQVVSLLYI